MPNGFAFRCARRFGRKMGRLGMNPHRFGCLLENAEFCTELQNEAWDGYLRGMESGNG